MNKIKVGSDFSGVGAFNQALKRLNIFYEEIFACDMDKYARQTFIQNYGEPKYYPYDVYERKIPNDSLDIYMTSPPCQSFSLAGRRLGKKDKRGILFFNSYDFIQQNKPRYFIFENVKGLISDNDGRTFREWLNMLGGKSVNGNPVIFPFEDSVPYHIYWQILNAKDYGIPQNRERVFIVGIRDDCDNNFTFPKKEFLNKRLKDVLENEVDEKYFLSNKMVETLKRHNNNIIQKDNPDKSATIHAGYFKMGGRDQQYIKTENIQIFNNSNGNSNVIGNLSGGKWNKIHESARRVYNIESYSPSIHTMQGGNLHPKIMQVGQINESQSGAIYSTDGLAVAQTGCGGGQGAKTGLYSIDNFKIRRLTPRECFRLMDFPDSFMWNVSDSQAYKQAGNSIVVAVLSKIIQKLNFCKK